MCEAVARTLFLAVVRRLLHGGPARPEVEPGEVLVEEALADLPVELQVSLEVPGALAPVPVLRAHDDVLELGVGGFLRGVAAEVRAMSARSRAHRSPRTVSMGPSGLDHFQMSRRSKTDGLLHVKHQCFKGWPFHALGPGGPGPSSAGGGPAPLPAASEHSGVAPVHGFAGSACNGHAPAPASA